MEMALGVRRRGIATLSADQFPEMLERSLERRSLFRTIEDEYGIHLAYADEDVDATGADPRAARLLGAARRAVAAHPPDPLRNHRQADRLHPGLVPLRPALALDPALPLIQRDDPGAEA